jgi:hypothetical protein
MSGKPRISAALPEIPKELQELLLHSDHNLQIKLLCLRAADLYMEHLLRREGVFGDNSMGATVFDVETGTGCPFVPTPFDVIVKAFAYARDHLKGENRTLVDLGSGLGLPAFIAKLFGFHPTGIELNPDFCTAATHLTTCYPSAPEIKDVRFKNTSFYDANMRDVGFVYMYLWDDAITDFQQLRKKLADELRPGAIIITYGFMYAEPPANRFRLVFQIPICPRFIKFYEIV